MAMVEAPRRAQTSTRARQRVRVAEEGNQSPHGKRGSLLLRRGKVSKAKLAVRLSDAQARDREVGGDQDMWSASVPFGVNSLPR